MILDKHSPGSIAAKLSLDDNEIARRKAFVEFSDADAQLLLQAHDLLLPFQSEFLDVFYQHIFSFIEMREAVTRAGVDPDVLKNVQKAYFESLTSGVYDLDYFLNRLKVGLAHERAGIEIKWYLGAYRKYITELFLYVNNVLKNDPERKTQLFVALNKIISLDIGMAVDAYIYMSREAVLELERRQDNLIRGIDGFIWEFDAITRQYRYVSSKVESLLGYSPKQWLDNPDFHRLIILPDYKRAALLAFDHAIHEGKSFMLEFRVYAADGRPVWVSERVTVEKDTAGSVVLLRGLMLDIGERKRHEEQLSYLATNDELTGLPNRNLFSSHLKIALAEAKRSNRQLALMFLDLDGFKDVNDSLGHEAGDKLLQLIGTRLKEHSLREMDFVARFGGDEFCIVLEQIQDDFRPERIAERCLEEIAKPTRIGTNTLYPSASIGITMYPNDGGTPETLLQCADNAMYAAKSSGKNRYAFYNTEMTVLAERRLALESDLRKAVEQGCFELYYQPQVSLSSGKMVAVEALIRWRDPVRGLVPPDDFIPIAEKIGLIPAVGEWVLTRASRQFVQWRQAGVEVDHIAVNISSSHFRTGKLPATIAKIMLETGIQAEELEIEVTESVLQTGQDCLACFRELKRLGMDDYFVVPDDP
ncbi:MAG: diguanylate cyclase domain-containing protein, partial [Gammaproteobacteria bacterium]